MMAKYTKRSGTSGIQGHLYETKLLSLIYFRAIHTHYIKEFYLATNVDKLGTFDDICFRAKACGITKPFSVFVQAKHRENNTVLTLNSKRDLETHFNSYLAIRSKFKPNNKDVLFDGAFSETECLFVIYTTAKVDGNARKYKPSGAFFLHILIGTGVFDSGLHPLDESKQAELIQILLEEEITALARLMAKCIHGEFKDVQMLVLEDVVLRYHAVLAQQVFDVSMEQSGRLRDAHFRQDFFDFKIVPLFKEKLCTEILKKLKFVSDTSLACCGVTDIDNAYQEIKHFITYDNRKFEFLDEIKSARYKLFLDKINESQETIRRTLEIAVKECLPSLTFRVPAWFGNKDLTMRGGNEKQERKLIDLTSKMVEIIEKSRESSNIVIIDESLDEGFLKLSGGIASAVGNILVLDDVSKLLKFNDNHKSLGKLAKKLFDHLNCKIENLYEFKFDVRVKIFPKLSFDADEYTKNIVRDFSNRLIIYTSQAKEAKVEKMVINVIEIRRCRRDDIHAQNIKSNTVFLQYHDDIQKWWMKKEGEYLTKGGCLYKNAEKHALSQPLTSCLNMMQRMNSKKYVFTEEAVNSIKLDDQPSGTVIVTKNITLTVAKLVNHRIKKDCVVLNMQYILNLSTSDAETLQTELIDLKKENTVIFACDKAVFGRKSDEEKIANITKSFRDITAIIILNDEDFVEKVKIYVTLKDSVVKDERNNLIDMSEESQKGILENTNVIFQGVEVNLEQVLNDKTIVGELVLNKLMQTDTNIIGKPTSESNYKGTIYIERSVKCLKAVTQTFKARDRKLEEGEIKSISTLYDLEDDVVLVIGDPGMGKSTLLTQLSLKTKQRKPTDWILRINLLENSKQLFMWQDSETVIDTLISLKFLCQVALSEESIRKNDVEITLEDLDGTVSLKDCDGDEWTVFELKMFLHFYNTRQIIILFDGFDEICPTYAHEVLSLIKAVMNLRHKHKIWIASRSYDKIITELDLQIFYKIEPLTTVQQDLYLSSFWEERNLLGKKKEVRNNNIFDFCRFMLKSDDLLMFKRKSHLPDVSINEKPMLAVYLSLFKYLEPNVTLYNVAYPRFEDRFTKFKSHYSGLVATPFYLNMLAEHLYNQIDGNDADDGQARNFTNSNSMERYVSCLTRRKINISIKWDLDVNLFEVYNHFLEYKLKIRFQEKNQNDLYRPDNREQFKRAYTDTKDKLKILAAYVVYNKRLLDKNELKRCEEIINKLKEGEENTDIICNVVNDIPIFVHSTFAEYFAVEYICQLIEGQRNLQNIYNFILNVMFFKLNKNLLVLLDAKIKVDKKFTTIIEKNKGIIFRLLLEQGKIIRNKHGCIKSSLCEAIRLGLKNLAFLLLSSNEVYMHARNLMDFIKIVKETNMLMIAVKMEFDELLITLINQVRMICESKLNALFENIEIFDKNDNLAQESTSDLVQKLHANVWTRMDIVPDWENLRDLGGQIYFI